MLSLDGNVIRDLSRNKGDQIVACMLRDKLLMFPRYKEEHTLIYKLELLFKKNVEWISEGV